jgi:oligoribonuclease NrnB/cAMP/cGMP phosphodiesterase (DHH superfamily)
MRIVTRPDFDGIVCAVLLFQAENIEGDVKWTEPNEIQTRMIEIKDGDILANLPYSEDGSLWFDHHISNKPDGPFNGGFAIAPSAARVIYDYYQEKGVLDNRYDELLINTDIIDAADLNLDQVKYPEKYPYIILSMTIKNKDYADIAYWNHLIELLTGTPIDKIMQDPEVKKRCGVVIKENTDFKAHLLKHTKVVNKISITDFRSLDKAPSGNRFLTYSIFPETIASMKLRFLRSDREQVLLSIGKSLFNGPCHVNIGKLLALYGGGGHDGAGGCTLDAKTADADIEKILAVLFENKS